MGFGGFVVLVWFWLFFVCLFVFLHEILDFSVSIFISRHTGAIKATAYKNGATSVQDLSPWTFGQAKVSKSNRQISFKA